MRARALTDPNPERRPLVTAHRELAVAIVLIALVGTVWASYLAYKVRDSVRLRLAATLTTTAIALQAVFGIVLAGGGQRPQDALHFVFGPATLLALPVARFAARGRPIRAASLILAAGWLVTLSLSLRATGSGGGLT